MLMGSGSHGASEVGWVEKAGHSKVNVVCSPSGTPEDIAAGEMTPVEPGLLIFKKNGESGFFILNLPALDCQMRKFPGNPMVKARCSHCSEPSFHPWPGTSDPALKK